MFLHEASQGLRRGQGQKQSYSAYASPDAIQLEEII